MIVLNLSGEIYRSIEGHELKREEGNTPNGNEFGGRWVYRDIGGQLVDFDQYRNDIVERNNLKLVQHNNL